MTRVAAFLAVLCCSLAFAACSGAATDDGPSDGGATDEADAGPVSKCAGTPKACSARTAEECVAEAACAVSTTAGSCAPPHCPAGVTCHAPGDCGTFTTSPTCEARSGCNWTAACEGTAKACTAMSDADCTKNVGCSLP